MTGGILQLVAKGVDDLFLTHDPDVTLFKMVYRRYSNFSILNRRINFSNKLTFGSASSCLIERYADLLNRLSVVFELSDINIVYNSLTKGLLQNILKQNGVTWTYSGSSTDIVDSATFSTAVTAINSQITVLTTELALMNTVITTINNINTLNGGALTDSRSFIDKALDQLLPLSSDTSIFQGLYEYLLAYRKDYNSTPLNVYNSNEIQLQMYQNYLNAIITPSLASMSLTTPQKTNIINNIIFYHVIDQGTYIYSTGLNGQANRTVFDVAINDFYNGSGYSTLDAYLVYNNYFTNLSSSQSLITSQFDIANTKAVLLDNIFWNLSENFYLFSALMNILKFNQSYSTYTALPINYYRFGFVKKFFPLGNRTYDGSNQFTNLTGNISSSLIADNFTTTISQASSNQPSDVTFFYGNYVNNQVSLMNSTNINSFNNTLLNPYFTDYNLWSRFVTSAVVTANSIPVPAGISPTDLDGILLMNLIPLVMCDDIYNMINTIGATDTTVNMVLGTITASILADMTTIKSTLINNFNIFENLATDITLTNNAFSYLSKTSDLFGPAGGYALTFLFRPEFQTNIFFNPADPGIVAVNHDVHVVMDNTPGYLSTGDLTNLTNQFGGFLKLKPVEYVYIRFFYEINKGMSLIGPGVLTPTQTTYVQTFLWNIVNLFCTNISANYFPTYTQYKNNNFTLYNISNSATINNGTTNPPYIDAVGSIWYGISKMLATNFNNCFDNIHLVNPIGFLNSTYYTQNLGVMMNDVRANAVTLVGSDFDFLDFYGDRFSDISNSLGDTIITFSSTTYLGSFSAILSNYKQYNSLLLMKSIQLQNVVPTIYSTTAGSIYDTYATYINSFSDIYNPNNYAFITNLIVSTRVVMITTLETEIYGFADIINAVNTDLLAASVAVTNPYNSITLPNLFSIWNTYSHAMASIYSQYVTLISPINLTNTTALYVNYTLQETYNFFGTRTNIVQYLIDLVIDGTRYSDLILLAPQNTTWITIYNAYLNNFNGHITSSINALSLISVFTGEIYMFLRSSLYYLLSFYMNNQGSGRFAWTPYIAFNLIDKISIVINGQKIEERTGEQLFLEYTKSLYVGQKRGFDILTGNTPQLTTYDINKKVKTQIYAPLTFWFCRHISESLPLVAMQYCEIGINISIKDFSQVAIWDSGTTFTKKPDIISSYLMADFVYVEAEERKTLASTKHEYLIECSKTAGFDIINLSDIDITGLTPNTVQLDYNLDNMCKHMYWTTKFINGPTDASGSLQIGNLTKSQIETYNWNKYCYIDYGIDPTILKSSNYRKTKINPSDTNLSYNLFTQDIKNKNVTEYSWADETYVEYILNNTTIVTKKINDPICTLKIQFNDDDREGTKDALFYSNLQPKNYMWSSLEQGMYMYNFALFPRLLQPSGACNMSEINKVTLVAELSDEIINEMTDNGFQIRVDLYYQSYMILRIMSGLAATL